MKHDYFTITATGNTYPIREQLQSWAFHWEPELKAWVTESVLSFIIDLWMHHIASGKWPGVILHCKKAYVY